MKRAPGVTVVVEVVVVDQGMGAQSSWRCLDSPEFSVRPFENEGEAAAALREAPADVLVLASGSVAARAETVGRMKREHPGLEVVAMAAAGLSEVEIEQLVAAGVFGVIPQPTDSGAGAALVVRNAARCARLARMVSRREAVPLEALGLVVRVAPGMISHREWTAERSNYADLKLRALAEFDRAYVRSLLDHTQGNISRAARIAGLDRSNFRRIMKRSRPV